MELMTEHMNRIN